ncbi:LAMI_0D02542g1_1 [Lachancea mirantina]|uniref:LAMI_0D02542g1_1 n=1 Tax=Lachancea mirantina TaxID=1230905 RepID=A0A1G4J9I1_9SACH|nr:LAMI_0D02542g1_1 [Lachancea mirantina]
MSTDTMYFNSSRLMSMPGKNSTSYLQKPEKKALKNAKMNKYRQEKNGSEPIPAAQTLPNGQKPDFGNSGRKKPNDERRHAGNGGRGRRGNKNNSRRAPDTADELTRDFKEFLSVEDGDQTAKRGEGHPGDGGGSGVRVNNAISGRTALKSPKECPNDQQTTLQNPHFPVKTPTLQAQPLPLPSQGYPPVHYSPAVSPMPYFNPPPLSASSIPNQPGLFQQEFQHQQQCYKMHNGYPPWNYQPNYALTSGALPSFTAPQSALMGIPNTVPPNYFTFPAPPMQVPKQLPDNASSFSESSPNTTPMQTRSQSSRSSSGSAPEYKRSPSGFKNHVQPNTTAGGKKTRKSSGGNGNSRSGYAGASFATSLPEVATLPKPSFA